MATGLPTGNLLTRMLRVCQILLTDPCQTSLKVTSLHPWEYFSARAEQKGVGLSQLLTDVLKRDIEINEP